MGLKQILAIVKKNMLTITKDRRTFGLLIFMPILLMLFFGYGFNQDVQNVPIKIVNLDEGGSGFPQINISDTQFSSIGIEFLKDDKRVKISEIVKEDFNLAKERDKIYGRDGYYALLIFPENFTENLPNLESAINLTILIDGSEVQTAGSIKTAVIEMVTYISNSISGENNHLHLDFDYVAGSPDLRPIDTLAPGILSFAILLFMILNVTGGFTKERTSGTLYRVVATNTSKSDILLGYMLGNSIIALIQSSLLLTIAAFLFNLHIVGNLLLLYFILFIYAISCIGLSILAAAFAKTELQAFQFIPIIIIPSMFFSGFIFPLLSFPPIFQWFSVVLPMTYSINISRAIMINGLGLDAFLGDFLILIALTLIFLVIAILILRTKK